MSSHPSAQVSLDPGVSQDAAASAALDPPVRASHPDQGLPERVVITMLHQSATGQEGPLWGGLDPSGLRLLQNRSVTQMVWATEVLVRGTVLRTAYPYVHLHNLISVFGDGVSRHFWTIGPHERRTSTLKYLFVFSSAFVHLSISPSLSCAICSWRFTTSQSSSSSKQIDNLGIIQPIFSSITHKNLTMAGSAPAASKDIKSVLENKPLKFKFKTGGASYIAQVHTDRSS